MWYVAGIYSLVFLWICVGLWQQRSLKKSVGISEDERKAKGKDQTWVQNNLEFEAKRTETVEHRMRMLKKST